jgi:hypothetical protein
LVLNSSLLSGFMKETEGGGEKRGKRERLTKKRMRNSPKEQSGSRVSGFSTSKVVSLPSTCAMGNEAELLRLTE